MSYYKDLDMRNELATIKHTQEPSMLVPLSLIMDIYVMAVTSGNKEVVDGLKKVIRGE